MEQKEKNMNRSALLILSFACFALLSEGIAEAGRTPTRRAPTVRARGAKPSIVVPYLNNGLSSFGMYHGVAPRVYSGPVVGNPKNPGSRPVFNLPFYGGKMGFSSKGNGAVTRPKLIPQPIHR